MSPSFRIMLKQAIRDACDAVSESMLNTSDICEKHHEKEFRAILDSLTVLKSEIQKCHTCESQNDRQKVIESTGCDTSNTNAPIWISSDFLLHEESGPLPPRFVSYDHVYQHIGDSIIPKSNHAKGSIPSLFDKLARDSHPDKRFKDDLGRIYILQGIDTLSPGGNEKWRNNTKKYTAKKTKSANETKRCQFTVKGDPKRCVCLKYEWQGQKYHLYHFFVSQYGGTKKSHSLQESHDTQSTEIVAGEDNGDECYADWTAEKIARWEYLVNFCSTSGTRPLNGTPALDDL